MKITRPERVQAAFEVWHNVADTGPSATAMFEYILSLEAALSHESAEAVEPVAWRWRHKGSKWTVQKNYPHWYKPETREFPDTEVEPLFTRPDNGREAELREALGKPFCVLFLDGRNEHGSHVLPSYPRSFEADDSSQTNIEESAENILCEAEANGFVVGEDHVWAEFMWIKPQIGEFGCVELAGYWEFDRINVEMTRAALKSAEAV